MRGLDPQQILNILWAKAQLQQRCLKSTKKPIRKFCRRPQRRKKPLITAHNETKTCGWMKSTWVAQTGLACLVWIQQYEREGVTQLTHNKNHSVECFDSTATLAEQVSEAVMLDKVSQTENKTSRLGRMTVTYRAMFHFLLCNIN